MVWNRVLEKGKALGIRPCGLGARDTLRLEMCYPLNGSDLSPEHNPIEAGLGFFVDLKKPKFIGREVLANAQGEWPTQTTRSLPHERQRAAAASALFRLARRERIGEVTSGTLSPSLNYGIGMAYLPTAARESRHRDWKLKFAAKNFPP